MEKTNLSRFETALRREERSEATIRKYLHDVTYFDSWARRFSPDGKDITKEMVVAYKEALLKEYHISSVNSMLAALNKYLKFCGREDLRVQFYRTQRSYFRDVRNELSMEDYRLLVRTAGIRRDDTVLLLLQTFGCTGIRASELPFITLEAAQAGRAGIHNKGKWREVYLPEDLREALLAYCEKHGVSGGSIFRSRTGRPLSRGDVWKRLKVLAKNAGVPEERVYPHNLRHLFALSYYRVSHDIAHLADLLGHSSIETTRRYTLEVITREEEVLRKMGMFTKKQP